MTKPIVFLSHAAEDAEVALRLRKWLRAKTAGAIEFFLSCDRDSLPPGEIWADAIAKTLDNATMVIVLTTSVSERSPWVAFEAGYARGLKKRVIPLLPPGHEVARLKTPLDLHQQLAVKSGSDLGAIIHELNKDLGTEFSVAADETDVEELFAGLQEYWQLDATPLMSRETMYGEITRRVKSAMRSERICVTSTLPHQVNDPDPPFEAYIAAVAAKCAEAKRHDDTADYTVAMAYKLDSNRMPPPDRIEAIRFRQKAFADAGASDRITLLQLDDHWLMDVMTIGHENALIAFPRRENDPKLRHAIWINGHKFVSLLNEWFHNCVKPRCRSVDPVTLQASDRRQS